MRFIKFCKSEHNVKTGCPTLQLGTFQYYRELDPSFSIADEHEGQISYKAEPTADAPLLLTLEQWNAISGGRVSITRQGQPYPSRWPGPVHFSMNGGQMELTGDGKVRYHGNLEIKHHYPNAYMFCMTALEEGEPIPDPSKIDPSYNSYYEVQADSLPRFMEIVGNLLHHSLNYQDVLFDHLHEPAPLSIPSQETYVTWVNRAISYVESRVTRLKAASDFEMNSLQNLYQNALFEKSTDYHGNKEHRIVFFVQHPRLGVMTVHKEPKILTINQVGLTLG